MLSTENHSTDFPIVKRPDYEAQSPPSRVHSLWMLEINLHPAIRLHGGNGDVFTCFTLTRPLIRFLYIRHVTPDCFRHSLPPRVPISNYKNGLLHGNGTATEFKFLGLQSCSTQGALPVLVLPPKLHVYWDRHEKLILLLSGEVRLHSISFSTSAAGNRLCSVQKTTSARLETSFNAWLINLHMMGLWYGRDVTTPGGRTRHCGLA